MFRATSDIAVVISTRSPIWKPSSSASMRPRTLAVITSWPVSTLTIVLSGIGAALGSPSQQVQRVVEVERRVDVRQVEAEPHHGVGDLGSDAHDHRLDPAQAYRLRDGAEHAGGEEVEHVQETDVDDHAARARVPDLARQQVLR